MYACLNLYLCRPADACHQHCNTGGLGISGIRQGEFRILRESRRSDIRPYQRQGNGKELAYFSRPLKVARESRWSIDEGRGR